jgi:hypothetical protein
VSTGRSDRGEDAYLLKDQPPWPAVDRGRSPGVPARWRLGSSASARVSSWSDRWARPRTGRRPIHRDPAKPGGVCRRPRPDSRALDQTHHICSVAATAREARHRSGLVQFGYDRDDKRSFPQIVYSLRCNPDGCPVAIEVFACNTADPKTLSAQITTVRRRFGVHRTAFVGVAKDKTTRTADALPVHSFRTMLADLGPLGNNCVRVRGKATLAPSRTGPHIFFRVFALACFRDRFHVVPARLASRRALASTATASRNLASCSAQVTESAAGRQPRCSRGLKSSGQSRQA